MHCGMKHLYFLLIASLLLLASCGEKPTTKQDKTAKNIPQREGILWGEIHYGTLNEYGETDEATLLYATADGTVDSVAFVLS